MILYGFHKTELGELLAGVSGRRICWLSFVMKNRPRALRELSDFAGEEGLSEDDAETGAILAGALGWALRRAHPAPAVALSGTDFQKAVWQALMDIPPGKTESYGELAGRIGRPHAARAVGQAAAANRIAIIVPCHRLVGAHGVPGEFRWGGAVKRRLLEKENGS